MDWSVLRPLSPFSIDSDTVDLFDIASKGERKEKLSLLGGAVGFLTGSLVAAAGFNQFLLPSEAGPVGVVIGFIGFLAIGFAGASFDHRRKQASQQKVEDLEERARNDPAEPKLAWDLARLKLENYLDRNLRQVSSIFYLTSVVMISGLAIIGYGVWRAIQNPALLDPSILAALAGVCVEAIGGTLLLIYRSTMAQANDFVVVLERINAVGMSINILDGMDADNRQLRDEARARLAHNLLGMYKSKGMPKPERSSN